MYLLRHGCRENTERWRKTHDLIIINPKGFINLLKRCRVRDSSPQSLQSTKAKSIEIYGKLDRSIRWWNDRPDLKWSIQNPMTFLLMLDRSILMYINRFEVQKWPLTPSLLPSLVSYALDFIQTCFNLKRF